MIVKRFNENIGKFQFEFIDSGDYIVDDNTKVDNYYYLWFVYNSSENKLLVKKLYSYNIEYNELKNENEKIRDIGKHLFFKGDGSTTIIFKSSNKKKAIDYLKMLIDIKKYNL